MKQRPFRLPSDFNIWMRLAFLIYAITLFPSWIVRCMRSVPVDSI